MYQKTNLVAVNGVVRTFGYIPLISKIPLRWMEFIFGPDWEKFLSEKKLVLVRDNEGYYTVNAEVANEVRNN